MNIHTKYVDWSVCVISVNILIIRLRHASLITVENIDIFPRFSYVENAYE